MSEPGVPCYSCEHNGKLDAARPDQAVWVEHGWVVAHSFNSALLGWLVVLPLRHVESFHELSQDEAQALGDLLRRVSAALIAVLECTKTYAVMFAEAPGFEHLHVHIIPRPRDLPDELQGCKIFDYLKRPEAEWVSQRERERLALALREAAVSPG
ncbi:MAG: HIT family protein [Candidatus Dormibacteria bacterium]